MKLTSQHERRFIAYTVQSTQFDIHLSSELLTKRTNKFESTRKI